MATDIVEYDAFISYRHRAPDMETAERIQNLLERFRVPADFGKRRIGPIFRDKTELPAGKDLGETIREALRHSRFLIVVLSEDTAKSPWCMEEIRFFKECRKGRIDHILPVLIGGEPEEVLPDILRFEEVPGPEGTALREVEPLMGDIRADTRRGMRKKLKTEYLRLAAQILGCRFDELYQRRRRHERRVRTAVAGGVIGLMSVTLAVISVFAYRTAVSEKRYRKSLVSQLIQRGAGFGGEGDASSALLYFTHALEIEPGNGSAAAGALATLQSGCWAASDGGAAKADAEAAPEDPKPCGTLLEEPGQGGQDAFVYLDGQRLFFREREKDLLYTVTFPADENPRLWDFEREERAAAEHRPRARLVRRDRDVGAVVTYGGYAYFYVFGPSEGAGGPEAVQGRLDWSLDLCEVYEDRAGFGRIAFDNPVEVSRENGIAVIRNGFDRCMCALSLFDHRVLCRSLPEDVYYAGDVMTDSLVLSPDGSVMAMYVRDYVSGYDNNHRVYGIGIGGEILYRTETEYSDVPVCLRWSDTGKVLMILRRGSVELTDAVTGERICPRIPVNGAADGQFTGGTDLRIEDETGRTSDISLYAFGPAEGAAGPVPYRVRGAEVWEKDGGLYSRADAPGGAVLLGHWVNGECLFSVRNDSRDPCLVLLDGDGEEKDRAPFPDADMFYEGWVDAESATAYFYPMDVDATKLYRCAIDTEKGSLGPVETLDTGGLRIAGPIMRLGGGCAFFTPGSELVFIGPGKTAPETVVRLKEGRVVRDESAAAGTGRTVIAVRRGERTCAELWDLKEGVCLCVLESTERQLSVWDMPEGCVSVREYEYGQDPEGEQTMTFLRERVYRLKAPEAAAGTLEALYALSGREWNDSAAAPVRTPVFDGDLDSWNDSICTDVGLIRLTE